MLDIVDAPLVSGDFNHNPASASFALDQTKVIDGTFRARDELVRQRVGLLQPDGRHDHRDGKADLNGNGRLPHAG